MFKLHKMCEKYIIDVCCGGKMFYFDKNDSRVLFQDIRRVKTTLCDGRSFEVNPDVIGDFTNMSFPDESFRLVIFDPPHLTGEGKNPGWQHIKYGCLDRKTWKQTIRKGFSECFRILKPNGILVFKWNETRYPVSQILELTPYNPILGHKSGRASKTHWLLFIKD